MPEALIQIVDKKDRLIGKAGKDEAWKRGLIHRVVRIMIEDGKGNVLLQKRMSTKPLYPGRWDNSTAGHVDAGETYEQAAKRELFEEIGLKDVAFKEIGYFYAESKFEWRIMKKFAKVYKLIMTKTPTNLGKDEVAEVKWFAVDKVKRMIAENPEQFTDGVLQVFERHY